MKKIISTIAMLTVLSTSFALKTEKWQGVILPCSHNEKGELQFLLEQDGEGKFKGIENEIKIDVEGDDLSDVQKQEASKQTNIILGDIGLNKDNTVHISNFSETNSHTRALTFLVDPDVELKKTKKYQWINASEAGQKTDNSDDKNLKKILTSTGWGEKGDKNFIDIMTNKALEKYFMQTFYLDKKNVLLKTRTDDKNNLYLEPLNTSLKTLAELKASDAKDKLYKSDVFPTTYNYGQFWKVFFKDASTLENKTGWVDVETKTFNNVIEDDKKITIDSKNYTIDKEIFNALATNLQKYKEAEEEKKKKTKEGEGKTGENKGDAEAKEIVYKFAETLSKLTKA